MLFFGMRNDITDVLSNCKSIKPNDLIIEDLQWKYLVRSVLRGKNVILLGPTRCGKTKAAQSVALALKRKDKYFEFNLGSTQDARSTLIGNTSFKEKTGTIFNPSRFVKAIQTPDAIILLDELSRGHHDAWNILMPVLDPTRKCLQLDETDDSTVIQVPDTVTFIATANVGNEYTSTRVMDKALTSRFPVIIEMNPLDAEKEKELLSILFPKTTPEEKTAFFNICRISGDTKIQFKLDNAKITSFIPTGTVVEMAELVLDGFALSEIAEMVIYPLFSDEGGAESERLFIKQLVQKYLDLKSASVNTPINDPLKPKKVILAF